MYFLTPRSKQCISLLLGQNSVSCLLSTKTVVFLSPEYKTVVFLSPRSKTVVSCLLGPKQWFLLVSRSKQWFSCLHVKTVVLPQFQAKQCIYPCNAEGGRLAGPEGPDGLVTL